MRKSYPRNCTDICMSLTLGIVQRYVYVDRFAISDSLCTSYDVKITARHVPVRSSIEDIITVIPAPKNSASGFGGRGYNQPKNQAMPPQQQVQPKVPAVRTYYSSIFSRKVPIFSHIININEKIWNFILKDMSKILLLHASLTIDKIMRYCCKNVLIAELNARRA